MNSQKYKIQALIAEIDEVLSKPVPRLPWTGSIDLVHQRQLLERVRTHLVSPDSKLMVAQKQANSPKSPPPPVPVPKVPLPTTNQRSATEQILQAVTGEISHLRESLTGPLQADIQALRQEQQALVQEIKQLEVKRQQQQSLAQQQANQQQIISEFLQALTSRLQETLVSDFSPSPRSLENQSLGSTSGSLDLNQQTPIEYPLLTPVERLEAMQRFEIQADRLLMRLDSTIDSVFESLQGNLESYQASLSQGLERMHGLGQQSEMMFTALVNHLAEELGREASSYVQQPTIDLSNQSATSSSQMLPNTAQIQLNAESPMAFVAIADESNEALEEQERFPYAGTELSPQFGQLRRDRTPVDISLPDLAENLFGLAPQIDRPTPPFPDAQSEPASAETDEDVEDMYANLFLGEEFVELDLEDFIIENTATASEIELVQSENQPVAASHQSLNNSEDLFSNLLDEEESIAQSQPVAVSHQSLNNSEDLFSNLLDEEESIAQSQENPESAEPLNSTFELFQNLLNEDDSVEEFLGNENRDFVIANSVEKLTLDTPDLLEPEKVIAPPQFPEPTALKVQPQIDADDRENAETAPKGGEISGTDAGDQTRTALPSSIGTAEISSTSPNEAPPSSNARIAPTNLDRSNVAPEEIYIQASADENLLPVERENQEDVDRSLNLDNDILQQLESDLYSLEGLQNTSPERSQPSATVNSGFLVGASDSIENPFAELAEAELGTLEDLFPDMLELSSEDEMDEIFSLEEELDVELLAEDENGDVSLDDILASLTATDQTSTPISGETQRLRSNTPESQKKN